MKTILKRIRMAWRAFRYRGNLPLSELLSYTGDRPVLELLRHDKMLLVTIEGENIHIKYDMTGTELFEAQDIIEAQAQAEAQKLRANLN